MMYIVDKLPTGKFKVHGFNGEFTSKELEKLQRLLDVDNTGINIWVI